MPKKNQAVLKLSPLEKDVLECLWEKEQMYVREIYNCLKGSRKVALTSIAVILDRLHEKGLVKRATEQSRGGFRYRYSALKDQLELERSMVEDAVDSLISKFGKTAVSYFNERFSK